MSTEGNKSINWYRLDPKEVLEKLQSSGKGLASEEAHKRLERYGPNELIEKKRKSLWMMFLDQFKDFMILVLIAAAVVAGVIGDPVGYHRHRRDCDAERRAWVRSGIPGRKGHGRSEKAGRPFGDRHSGRAGPNRSPRNGLFPVTW